MEISTPVHISYTLYIATPTSPSPLLLHILYLPAITPPPPPPPPRSQSATNIYHPHLLKYATKPMVTLHPPPPPPHPPSSSPPPSNLPIYSPPLYWPLFYQYPTAILYIPQFLLPKCTPNLRSQAVWLLVS